MSIYPQFQLHRTETTIPYVLFYDRAGAFIANHWHKELEIVYALKGGTLMAVNNHVYELHEGDIAVVMSGDAHFYFHSENHERMVVMFSPRIAEPLLPDEKSRRALRCALKSAARLSSQWQPCHAQEARDILHRLAELNDNGRPGRELAVCARLFDFILLAAGSVSRDETQRSTYESAGQTKLLSNLEKVFDYVENNYFRDIDLGSAAALLGFEPSYFARFFKRLTGTTFMRYVTDYRISRAQSMLANENLGVTQIAERAGFGSIKTFNRVFLKLAGMSPTAYIKSISEDTGA